MATAQRLADHDLAPHPSTLLVAGAMVLAEVLLVAWYYALSETAVLVDPTTVLYPFVWINVGVLAVWRTTPAPTTPRRTAVAGLVAAGYFVVLSYFGGILAPGYALSGLAGEPSLTALVDVPPGFGPALLYGGPLVDVALIPYKAVGYLALAYLVYATVVDAAGAAAVGLLGLLSCVSCTWPILASVLSGVTGATGSLAFAGASYELSTLVFVVTVALLYWRPLGR
jgi:hypothetical protein